MSTTLTAKQRKALDKAIIAAGFDPAEVLLKKAQITAPKTASRKGKAAPKPAPTGKPVNRTNREAVIEAMTAEGWTGHEHYSASDLKELLREQGCPKGFYVPTGAVKARIKAAQG